MALIGLVIRDDREAILSLSRKVVDWAESQGHAISLETNTARFLGLEDKFETVPAHELALQADPIVTLGGDGTMIGIARHAGAHSPRLLGVNFGTLGFLTEISPDQLIDCLAETLAGNASFATRAMLRITVSRKQKIVFESQSINDVVIQKGSRDPLLSLDVFCDQEEVMRIRADGLIFSTPTGSTAYSLAAGGAIVHRGLDVVQITPICPHLLTSRPLILPMDSKLAVVVPEHRGEIFVSVDGQASFSLSTGDVIDIAESKNTVQIARSPSGSYYEILRGRLNWTIPNKPM